MFSSPLVLQIPSSMQMTDEQLVLKGHIVMVEWNSLNNPPM
ncbi:MAG: hypothetical protein V7K33_05285 [Nostoc sp.]